MNIQLNDVLPEGLSAREKLEVNGLARRLHQFATLTADERETFHSHIDKEVTLSRQPNGRKIFINNKTGQPVTGAAEKVLFVFYSQVQEFVCPVSRENKLYSKYEQEIFKDLVALGTDPDYAGFTTKRAVECYLAEIAPEFFGIAYYNILVDANWLFVVRDGRAFFYTRNFERVSDPVNYALECVLADVVLP